MAIEINTSIENLRKRKIMIATPMYGGMCTGQYTRSITDLGILGEKYGMEIQFYYLYNESLITRARNYLVDEFLRSNFTHLMFIDADIGFDPSDVIALSIIAETGSDKHVVCGPYPKKCISWEKIKRAVDKGFADRDPNLLENYVGDYVFNPAGDSDQISLDEPAEVLEGGTGFMMIQREVFAKFAETHPMRAYLPDHVRTEHFDGSREIHAYFDCVIDRVDREKGYLETINQIRDKKLSDHEEIAKLISKNLADIEEQEKKKSKRYLSEDYMFCQYVRNMGMKVWLCPWMRLTHMGSYNFGGSLIDLAQIGAAATADVDAIGKKGKLGAKKKKRN